MANPFVLHASSFVASCLLTHAAKSLQSCPTLCDPIDGSPPGPSIHGIFQATVLEWVPSFTETLSLECPLNAKPTQHFLLFFEKSHSEFLMTFPTKEKQMRPQNSRFPICDTTQRKPHVKIPFFLFINFFPIAHCSAYECYVYSQLSKLMEASCGRDN